MNSLYTCSWGKNVAPLYNEDWAASVFDIITEAKGKRGKEAAPGYARLMSLKDIKKHHASNGSLSLSLPFLIDQRHEGKRKIKKEKHSEIVR